MKCKVNSRVNYMQIHGLVLLSPPCNVKHEKKHINILRTTCDWALSQAFLFHFFLARDWTMQTGNRFLHRNPAANWMLWAQDYYLHIAWLNRFTCTRMRTYSDARAMESPRNNRTNCTNLLLISQYKSTSCTTVHQIYIHLWETVSSRRPRQTDQCKCKG
jgi:hypothetical protein